MLDGRFDPAFQMIFLARDSNAQDGKAPTAAPGQPSRLSATMTRLAAVFGMARR